MKKLLKQIITAGLAAALALSLCIFACADAVESDVVTEFTIVGVSAADESGRRDIAISLRSKHFSVAENKELWYYTTANITVGGNSGIELSHDGTEQGRALYDLIVNNGTVQSLGGVVRLRWSGMVAETYPPQLCGIKALEFTGNATDYSALDIKSQREAMNEMFSDDCHYPDAVDPSAETSDRDTNPKTGAERVFSGIALCCVMAWAVSVISAGRGRNAEKSR